MEITPIRLLANSHMYPNVVQSTLQTQWWLSSRIHITTTSVATSVSISILTYTRYTFASYFCRNNIGNCWKRNKSKIKSNHDHDWHKQKEINIVGKMAIKITTTSATGASTIIIQMEKRKIKFSPHLHQMHKHQIN